MNVKLVKDGGHVFVHIFYRNVFPLVPLWRFNPDPASLERFASRAAIYAVIAGQSLRNFLLSVLGKRPYRYFQFCGN